MSLPPAIVALADQEHALRAGLLAWAEINSGSEHVAGLARMAEQLTAACRALTPDVSLLPVAADGRAIVRASARPEAPVQVLLSGHYDTVYPADHPFQHCTPLADGRHNGPGIADMKGGLVVLFAALAAFEQTPHAARVGWEILLTPDEETGSALTHEPLERAAPRHHLALVFEPGRETGELVRARMGTGIFTATCHGRAAHAGRDPRAGRNAIAALAEFLVGAHRVPDELPEVLLNIGRVEGGGTVNVVPDFARAEINVRAATRAAAEAVLARLHALAAPINAREGYRLELTGQFNRWPMEATPTRDALFAAWSRAAIDLGQPAPRWVDVGGGSDGNLLAAVGLPVLDGLGAVGGELHSAREWVDLETLVPRAQASALFLHRLAAGEIAAPPRAAAPTEGSRAES